MKWKKRQSLTVEEIMSKVRAVKSTNSVIIQIEDKDAPFMRKVGETKDKRTIIVAKSPDSSDESEKAFSCNYCHGRL